MKAGSPDPAAPRMDAEDQEIERLFAAEVARDRHDGDDHPHMNMTASFDRDQMPGEPGYKEPIHHSAPPQFDDQDRAWLAERNHWLHLAAECAQDAGKENDPQGHHKAGWLVYQTPCA